jgi:hypothetical protein
MKGLLLWEVERSESREGVVVFGCGVLGRWGRGGGGCRGRRMWEMRLSLWEVEWIESKEGGSISKPPPIARPTKLCMLA